VDGTSRVLVFRDLNEAAEEQANYLRYVELGPPLTRRVVSEMPREIKEVRSHKEEKIRT